MTDLTFRQNWALDPVGNWTDFDQDDDGNRTYDLEQDRDHNKVNEITDITAPGSQPQWATPAYDANGNTTTFPKPSSLTNSYTAVYDPDKRGTTAEFVLRVVE